MDINTINKILEDTAYVRTGGSAEELRCAEYLMARCADIGLEAHLEEFSVKCGKVTRAKLVVTAPYVKVGGAVVALKGSAAREELAEAAGAVKKLGLKLEEIRDFTVDGASHSIILLRKIAPTPPQYPRRYAKIKQFPL